MCLKYWDCSNYMHYNSNAEMQNIVKVLFIQDNLETINHVFKFNLFSYFKIIIIIVI